MPKYSIVIPVYNRPDEVQELLTTLVMQTFKDFEVVIVEDGSTVDAQSVVNSFQSSLDIAYYVKENGGQGFARNFGYERAKGEYFIVFDSDCLIPSHYLQAVDDFLSKNPVDAFGGPDAAHPSFTIIQKAISQTMTSFFTTGGIRGNKTHVGTYHPRSFNMGISREVYGKTKGYIIPFMGEDMEFSTRILKEGFKTALIPEAFVYHKRRTDPRKFYKQLKYFGRARINLSRFHSGQVGIVHLFPTVFTLGMILSVLGIFILPSPVKWIGLIAYAIYFALVLIESLVITKSLKVALLTPVMTFLQMTGYGYGLVYEWVRKLRGINPNTKYIELY
jgi:glycosyltransferase involved in cell wall biosynthesis